MIKANRIKKRGEKMSNDIKELKKLYELLEYHLKFGTPRTVSEVRKLIENIENKKER